MILPSQNILALCNASKTPLITKFNDKNLRASSYDLTVGDEYYIGQEQQRSTLSVNRLRNRQSFSIPPHAVCFILAAESINLPKDISAKVSLRMTHIYAGLVLPTQPPFDPGYEGKIIVMLHNLSSDAVHMKRGDRLSTIEFVRLEIKSTSIKPHRSVEDIEGQLSRPVISSLAEIARKSESASSKVDWMMGQMLIFAALIVAVLAVPGFFSFNNLLDKIKDQDIKLGEMSQKIKGLADLIERERNASSGKRLLKE